MSIKTSTTKASLFVIGGKLILRSMDLIVLIVLARILTPSDFGIIAMAKTAVIILEGVTELPIANALVRQEKLTDSMFNTALTLNILRGLTITIFILAIFVLPMPISSSRILRFLQPYHPGRRRAGDMHVDEFVCGHMPWPGYHWQIPR